MESMIKRIFRNAFKQYVAEQITPVAEEAKRQIEVAAAQHAKLSAETLAHAKAKVEQASREVEQARAQTYGSLLAEFKRLGERMDNFGSLEAFEAWKKR
jgi:protein-disulfide isomerase-like protein with CxxC motif